MTDNDPKPRRGLLLRRKPGPDWEAIGWSARFVAVALTFCTLFLTISIGTLRD